MNYDTTGHRHRSHRSSVHPDWDINLCLFIFFRVCSGSLYLSLFCVLLQDVSIHLDQFCDLLCKLRSLVWCQLWSLCLTAALYLFCLSFLFFHHYFYHAVHPLLFCMLSLQLLCISLWSLCIPLCLSCILLNGHWEVSKCLHAAQSEKTFQMKVDFNWINLLSNFYVALNKHKVWGQDFTPKMNSVFLINIHLNVTSLSTLQWKCHPSYGEGHIIFQGWPIQIHLWA